MWGGRVGPVFGWVGRSTANQHFFRSAISYAVAPIYLLDLCLSCSSWCPFKS